MECADKPWLVTDETRFFDPPVSALDGAGTGNEWLIDHKFCSTAMCMICGVCLF